MLTDSVRFFITVFEAVGCYLYFAHASKQKDSRNENITNWDEMICGAKNAML